MFSDSKTMAVIVKYTFKVLLNWSQCKFKVVYHPDHGLQPNLYEAVTIGEKLSGNLKQVWQT